MDWLIILAVLWIVSIYFYSTSSFKVDPKEHIEYLEKELELKIQELNGKIVHKSKPKLFCSYTDSTPDLTPTKVLMFINAEEKLAYMQTKQWIELKEHRLRIAQYKCECCGSTYKLHLHHVTYERLTQEHIEDVAVLCNICHNRLHSILGYDRTTIYPISTIKD